MMASLRCDHPDIEAFLEAKRAPGALNHFNLSVLLTDDFMRAVRDDAPWPLVFPLGQHPVPPDGEVCQRVWPGRQAAQPCLVYRRVAARELWDRLLEAEHASAEPGVLFIDRINLSNNLWYCEHLATTNPCGEVPLPPWGACNLGSLNLTRFVQHPFGEHPDLDFGGLRAVAAVATRFLDDVYDISPFPLKAQEKAAHASRRIGLGITGLADALAMLGLAYGSPRSLHLTRQIMSAVRDTAYRTSVEIAREKNVFPEFDKIKYSASPFVLGLDHEIQDAILQYGIRNSHLLAIAPTGSISLLANNVSSGIEPILARAGRRRVRGADGRAINFDVLDDAWRRYQLIHGTDVAAPPAFAEAAEVGAEAQLAMMSEVQTCVDNAIAKTIRLPASARPADLGQVLLRAWELGLKGCAVMREGIRGTDVVLQSQAA
jgi:ribonucleoside-diphosphate reductase alpha chain